MTQLGWLIVIYSVISMALSFVNANLMIFWWVDLGGPIIGWILRFLILGAGIWVIRTADD